MYATLLILPSLLPQAPSEDPPALVLGETFAGEITNADPVVHTPTLGTRYTDAPVVGKTYVIEVEKGGPYTIELRSYFFDAYLVLRDGERKTLVEDDDGAVGIHARITAELESHAVYFVDACALHVECGAFELDLRRGRPAALSPDQERSAERADLERTVEVREKILGPEHPATARSLDNLAHLLHARGDYAAARPRYERALAIREKILGSESLWTAESLSSLAVLLRDQGDYAAARALLERSLAIFKKVRGPQHPDIAKNLGSLAIVLQAQGDYAAARPLYERSLAICENVLGPEHPNTATSLNNLAVLLWAQGDYATARALHERALTIRERLLGPEHPDTATSLTNLARLCQDQGDYAAARLLYERALAINEKVLGSDHPMTATSLNNLGGLLKAQGDYATARPLLERALAITEKLLAEHPDTATSLANLARLCQAQGDYAAARPLYERALAIRERLLPPDHPLTITSLDNLAGLLRAQGDYAAARPRYERALAIREKLLGPEHPDTATSLNNLASVLWFQGDYAAARPLLERALAIFERVLGPEHPDTAACLNNLADLFHAQGDYAAARPLFERALAIFEKVRGSEHPDTARSRYNLAILLIDRGFKSQSSDLARQALTSILGHAEHTLWALSENERLLFLRQGERTLDLNLSLARQPEPAARGAPAFELALAWRGLASRTLLESRARLQAKAPEGARAMIENLQGVQTQLSKLLYATKVPDRERHEREIHALRDRRNELEVELQRLIGPCAEHAVTLTELQEGLESGSAFLDFRVHPLYEPAEREGERVVCKGQWTPDHLSAWIVRHDRELVQLDLGPSAEVESAVKRWLEEIVSRRGISTGNEAVESGAKLRALLWEPLARQLEGVARVFVRPDSFLGTLPFEVLPLEGERYLIEEKDFVYVQTPLDLVEHKERTNAEAPSLLTVGGVDFQKRAHAPDPPKGSVVLAAARRGDEQCGSLSWGRLPNTEYEAQVVQDLFASRFEGAETLMLRADQATEERIKQELPRHTYLHLATHGFFHPEGTVSMWDSAGVPESAGARGIGGFRPVIDEEGFRGLEDETHALVGQFPGLLTGLACAGANTPAPEGRDDGLLTAEEVLWLDLSKVDLVVLSACETALGERRSGEGMIGLRRAFGLAGARTVVSSLWSVKDRSTGELMQHFYENLWLKKQGRAEALRNAQLELLAKNRVTEHDALPSTWGAFVLSGEWR